MKSTDTTLTIGDHSHDVNHKLAHARGFHICSMFEDTRDQFSMAAPFFATGLQSDEKCLYIADSNSEDEVVAALSRTRDIEGDIQSGRFSILTSAETYLKGGRFRPERMLRIIRDSEKRALAEGFSGARFAGEMTWYNSRKPGVKSLAEYEARINNLFPTSSANILCQYAESDFNPATLLDVVHTHPRIWLRGELCDNPYYIPPAEFMSLRRGKVPWGAYERVARDILRRASVVSMHRMESRELLDANRALDLLDSVALGDMRNQLSIMQFHTELAMDACRDSKLMSWLSEIRSDCSRIQGRLEAMRDIRALSIKELAWQNLGATIKAAEEAFEERLVRIAPEANGIEIYADKMLDKALTYILAYLHKRRRGDTGISVIARESKGLVSARFRLDGVGIPQEGKESIFQKGYGNGGLDGYGLFVAREILQATGLKIHEVGPPRKAIEFEITVPSGKYRMTRQ